MPNDVSSDWPGRVTEERIWFCSHLIGDDNNTVIEITPPEEIMHMSVELLLSVCESASADIFCAELTSE